MAPCRKAESPWARACLRRARFMVCLVHCGDQCWEPGCGLTWRDFSGFKWDGLSASSLCPSNPPFMQPPLEFENPNLIMLDCPRKNHWWTSIVYRAKPKARFLSGTACFTTCFISVICSCHALYVGAHFNLTELPLSLNSLCSVTLWGLCTPSVLCT